MALSRIDGPDELYVGGVWALRRSSALRKLGVTHVLSLVGFDLASLRKFPGERWDDGTDEPFRHLVIEVDDVEDTDLLAELPRALRFIHDGLTSGKRERLVEADEQRQKETKERPVREEGKEADDQEEGNGGEQALQGGMQTMQVSSNNRGGVVVRCAAGKSRSVAVVVAYLLWRYPRRFDPDLGPDDDCGPVTSGKADGAPPPRPPPPPLSLAISANAATSQPSANDKASWRQQQQQPSTGRRQRPRPRKETAREAVEAALALVRRTRPMAEPNPGFMRQLVLWWEMGCPDDDVQTQPAYQRWAYRRQVEVAVAAGQAPSRLRFEDEQQQRDGGACSPGSSSSELKLRCKRCRCTLATAAFILVHDPPPSSSSSSTPNHEASKLCPHYFVEPLAWMRTELEKGQLGGRLACPNDRCGAAVGRYDWKGIHCACGAWVTPGLSLQRARVDE